MSKVKIPGFSWWALFGFRAVNGAWERYINNLPSAQEALLNFADALYSFRWRKKYREELFILRDRLVRLARQVNSHQVPLERKKLSDWADMVSAYLLYLNRTGTETERRQVRMLVEATLMTGLNQLILFPENGGHTWSLLKLSQVQILIDRGKWLEADEELEKVGQSAHLIRDTNQRARVYRKLGILHRQTGNQEEGWRWSKQALRFGALSTKLKSLVALLGFDI